MNVLDPGKIDKIKNLLRHHPRGMTISDLSKSLKMNRNLLAKYLDVLLFSGHVEMQVTGTAKVYFISNRVPISAMLEFSSDYIIILDTELRIIQANARLLALLGETRETLIGVKIGEANNPVIQKLPTVLNPATPSSGCEKTLEIRTTIRDKTYYFSMKQVPTVFEDGSHGRTLIFEDITQRHLAEEKIKDYVFQMEFFSKKLQEFAELPPDADIYTAIGSGLDSLLPTAIIDINSYNTAEKILCKQSVLGKGCEEFVELCRKHNCSWERSPAYDSVAEVLSTGKLFHLPGKLRYASFEQIPASACEMIERKFNLGDFYSIGLVWRGNLMGNILFVLQQDDTIQNGNLIETYARAASIALQRHIAEQHYLASSFHQE